MKGPGIVAIRIRRGNTVFHVHGEQQGVEGVWLGQGQAEGIYDAPVRVTDKFGAFQIGSTRKAHKWLHRDMMLGFHVIETDDTIVGSFEWNESLFRQIFAYELDPWSEDPKPTVLEVETELSGVRKIDVLMYEQPEFTADVDPIMQQYGNIIMKLRANEPMWYETDIVSTFTGGAGAAAGFIEVENPTDQVMYHKWILTPAVWTLPDRQWVGDPGERTTGGEHGSRDVENITITAGNGGAVIDLDRQELMFRDLNNTNLLGQMGGAKIFNYPIPPYTPKQLLPISYSGAPGGGATAQLVQPRRWSRPYGLEAVSIVSPNVDLDMTTRFSYVGPYSYQIPTQAQFIDVVLIGGGGGGEDGSLFSFGKGGEAGNVVTATLERGVDIPWDTYYIGGLVGAGGSLGAGDGGQTTAVGAGMVTLSAAGGQGAGAPGQDGEGTGNTTFNGIVYAGSVDQEELDEPGHPPGGGGGGGWILGEDGGPGARGQVWFRAYQSGEIVQPNPASLTLTGHLARINIVMVVPAQRELTLTPGTPDVRVED